MKPFCELCQLTTAWMYVRTVHVYRLRATEGPVSPPVTVSAMKISDETPYRGGSRRKTVKLAGFTGFTCRWLGYKLSTAIQARFRRERTAKHANFMISVYAPRSLLRVSAPCTIDCC